MMTAPYTPETLKRIRQGASARELGWDEATYRDRCRKHGLEPVASASVTPVMEMQKRARAVEPQPVAPVFPEPPRMSVLQIESIIAAGHCAFDIHAGEICYRDKATLLTERQQEVFSMLANVELLAAHEVAAGLGITWTTGIMKSLRLALQRCGIGLIGTKGRAGGYRLGDLKTQQPIKVVRVRSGRVRK